MAIHRGRELNNVNETWNENAKRRERGEDSPVAPASAGAGSVREDLQQTISNEAAEYDNANKEDRILSGERATVSDEDGDA